VHRPLEAEVHVKPVEEQERLLAEEIAVGKPKRGRAMEKLFHGVSAGKVKCRSLAHW
jgi:hypothetical protein